MAEAVRNVVLAMTVVTAAHILLLMTERRRGEQPRRAPEASFEDGAERKSGACLQQEGFSSKSGIGGSSGMPLDGLREMFEFASARTADAGACDHSGLGIASEGAGMLKRTDEVCPTQISGQYAVVNAYEGEGVHNGGCADFGGVAAFDGWGDAASFEACQTDGTNSQ